MTDLPPPPQHVEPFVRILGPEGAVALRTLGLVPEAHLRQMADAGPIRPALYDYVVDASAVRHVFARHADAGVEASRGQRVVEPGDFARLAVLLNAPDAIEPAGIDRALGQTFRFSKRFGAETLVALFEVRARRRRLALVDTQVHGVWRQVNDLIGAFERLNSAGTLDQQIMAAETLKTTFLAAAAASGEISAEEDAVLRQIIQMIEQMRTFKAVVGQAPPIVDQIRAAAVAAGGAVDGIGAAASRIIPQLQAAAAAARDLARNATAAAEADATGSGATPNPINGNPGNTTFGNPYAGEGSSAPSRSLRPRSAPSNIDAGLPPVARTGGGGGVSAIEKQRDALAQLIEQERLALDIARELNPVQQEMLRNREALAGATAAERAQVEQLITARIRDEEAARALQDSWDIMGQSAFDALSGMIVQGKSASDVIANLASSLASAALQSAFLGTGPLAGVFGTAGEGGLLGAMFPGIKRAGGGPISGPGTATSDSIPVWASNGEFMINAASAAAYRPLLEQINADKQGALLRAAPRYANGGPIGGRSRGALLAMGGAAEQRIAIDLRLSGDLDARIESKSSEVAVRTVRSGLDQFNRSVLPGRVQQINADPRRKN